MTRQCLRGRAPPPSLTLGKLTVNARDQRFELTFTSPCVPLGLLTTCWTYLRPVTMLYLQETVVLLVDIFSRSASVLSRVT